MMPRKPSRIYQLKVTLNGCRPPIWRRILVPGNTTLLKLHDIIQIVMGWDSYHLHMYTIGGITYGDPADDEYGDFGTVNEANYTLNKVIYGEGQRFSYEYDFGDSWAHTILVEKILLPEKGTRYPLCLKGKRACPPEDVGGVWGYMNFLEAIHDPTHDEHEEYLEWIGGEFNPEEFNLEDVNTQLRSMGSGLSAEAKNAWAIDEAELQTDMADTISAWMQTLSVEQIEVAENLPLRKDMLTLLSYLRDNKVTGTQSTGNFPLKAVYEICAKFVKPLKLDKKIGETVVYRVRSESKVWPLYFRHILASVAELITGGPGRRWKLTVLGENFLTAPAPIQVWIMSATWWTQINWAIASPYSFGDGYMPSGFSKNAIRHLLDLPIETQVTFDLFADDLIKDAGLIWSIQDQDSAHRILRSMMKWTVVNPQLDFGILQAEYQPHKSLGEQYQELSTIQITPFGKSLLESIKEMVLS